MRSIWITRGSHHPMFFNPTSCDEDGYLVLDLPNDWTGKIIIRRQATESARTNSVPVRTCHALYAQADRTKGKGAGRVGEVGRESCTVIGRRRRQSMG